MNVFLDTNVIMDYLASRGDIHNVTKVFEAVDKGICKAYISVGSYYTLTYLMELFLKGRGIQNPERLKMLRDILESLLSKIEISEQTKTDLLLGTINDQFRDLEDSYQYQAALTSGCQYLVTSNLKDFQFADNTSISIVSPLDFANQIFG